MAKQIRMPAIVDVAQKTETAVSMQAPHYAG